MPFRSFGFYACVILDQAVKNCSSAWLSVKIYAATSVLLNLVTQQFDYVVQCLCASQLLKVICWWCITGVKLLLKTYIKAERILEMFLHLRLYVCKCLCLLVFNMHDIFVLAVSSLPARPLMAVRLEPVKQQPSLVSMGDNKAWLRQEFWVCRWGICSLLGLTRSDDLVMTVQARC